MAKKTKQEGVMKKLGRQGNQKILRIIFYLALIFELAFFQCVWPLSLARADSAVIDPPAQEQTAAPNPNEDTQPDSLNNANKTDTSGEKDDTAASGNTGAPVKAASAQENPDDFWKTCKLSDLLDQIKDEKKCDECKKKTTCDDIQICLKEEIKIENDANVDNKVETAADTGSNEAKIQDPRPDRDREARNEDASAQNIIPVTESGAESINGDNLTGGSTNEDVVPVAESNSIITPPEPVANSIVENDNSSAAGNDQTQEETEAKDQNDRSRDPSRLKDDRSSEEANNSGDSKNDASAEIASGDAVAVSDVVNEVNTNIVGSNGVEIVQNIDGNYAGDINLLDSFNSLFDNGKSINESNESVFDAASISIENKADVNNDIATTANTGQNEIENENESGDSAITTGDAVAVTNVANIVNTNIIGNNFLFAVINVFGNWVGNLIVPGEGLLTVPESAPADNLIVDAKNDSNIENNVETSATTGQNAIESESGSASVKTGDANAVNLVTNQVGSTVVKNNWFFLAINNMGNWVGNILNWNSEKNGYDTIFSFDFDEKENPDSDGISSWFTKIFVKNEANIENNVTTTASTGENKIDSEGGAADIKTGNAFAFSKIYNLVNNNFIGSNWLFAVVNIFGNWKGDVEFAYPDLSVTLSDNIGKVKKSDVFAYEITYKNDGRADCENVKAGVHLPDRVNFLSDTSGSSPHREGNDLSWDLAGLKAGEKKSFLVNVAAGDDLPENGAMLESEAAVATGTKETELANNIATDQIEVYNPALTDDAGGNSPDALSKQMIGSQNTAVEAINSALAMTRTVSKNKIAAGEITTHTIIAQNTGDTALQNIVVSDSVQNKKGNAGNFSWSVAKLDPGKKMVVTYKMMVNAGAPTGKYNNNSIAWGFDANGNEVRSNEARISISIHSVESMRNEQYFTYLDSQAPVLVFGAQTVLVATAEAAETVPKEGKIMGAWSNGDVCLGLPWWGWGVAAFLYFTAIHWALLRQKRIISPIKIKK